MAWIAVVWNYGGRSLWVTSESAHLISFKGAYHGWCLDWSYGHQFNPKTGKWDKNLLHKPVLYWCDLRGSQERKKTEPPSLGSSGVAR